MHTATDFIAESDTKHTASKTNTGIYFSLTAKVSTDALAGVDGTAGSSVNFSAIANSSKITVVAVSAVYGEAYCESDAICRLYEAAADKNSCAGVYFKTGSDWIGFCLD